MFQYGWPFVVTKAPSVFQDVCEVEGEKTQEGWGTDKLYMDEML